MATKRGSRPSTLQSGTNVQGPGRTSYYREGRNRSLTGYGYTAATYQGQYHLAGPSGNQVAFSPPDKTYHRAILAEFLACLMMVVASIILVPAQDRPEGSGRSFAKELVQLTAICIVFFVLALAATGAKTGKVAAAFGGLVTLGVAWNASGIFSALAKALGPAAAKTTSSSSQVAPTSTGQLPAGELFNQQLIGGG